MLQNISKNKTKKATWLAFFSIPLSGFVTDIYLPSFPSMSKSLQVSEQQIQLSLTFFLLSYGISQLFIGILLDHIGRYRPKLIAISLLILSNLLIAHSENIFFIYFFRILQGICTSLIIVSSRAFFVDLFEGEQLKKTLKLFHHHMVFRTDISSIHRWIPRKSLGVAIQFFISSTICCHSIYWRMVLGY